MMTELFFSRVCDFCDNEPDPSRMGHGFVINEPQGGAFEPFDAYVFRTWADAERWRTASARSGPIWEVLSFIHYRWHVSRGTLRDVVLADHMFEIFDTHKYENLPHRAYLWKLCDSENSPPV